MQVEYIMAADATVFFYPPWYKPAVTAFFFISLGVNTLATGLIVYKIVSVYNGIRGFNTSTYGPGQRDLYPLVSILIESGLITFVGQLLQSITYMFAQNIFSVFGGSVVMLYVRTSSCRLLIWCRKFIYLLHRGFRRQLSLCVSRWALHTTTIRQRRRIQRIRDAIYRLHHSHRSSITQALVPQMLRRRRRMMVLTHVHRPSSYTPFNFIFVLMYL